MNGYTSTPLAHQYLEKKERLTPPTTAACAKVLVVAAPQSNYEGEVVLIHAAASHLKKSCMHSKKYSSLTHKQQFKTSPITQTRTAKAPPPAEEYYA